MKPKVALVKDGFLPAGSENKRGRLSREAITRLEELAREGWNIDGYVVSNVSEATGPDESPAPREVKRQKPADASAVVEPKAETHSEAVWQSYVHVDGKREKVGTRTVCNNCGNSLTHCGCGDPRVWVKMGAEQAPVWWERV